MASILVHSYRTPCGSIRLASFASRICLCDWIRSPHSEYNIGRLGRMLDADFAEGSSDVIAATIRQLDEYFAGKHKVFDVPLLMCGTDFQKRVWVELQHIPYGSTVSYATIARRLGKPDAVRAVARAIGANPMSILVPCHRVIGTDGSLTGYAGGIPAKQHLLALEKIV